MWKKYKGKEKLSAGLNIYNAGPTQTMKYVAEKYNLKSAKSAQSTCIERSGRGAGEMTLTARRKGRMAQRNERYGLVPWAEALLQRSLLCRARRRTWWPVCINADSKLLNSDRNTLSIWLISIQKCNDILYSMWRISSSNQPVTTYSWLSNLFWSIQ